MDFYMSKKRAKELGATHYGKMFNVPVWLKGIDTDCPDVAAKFAPLEFWIKLCSYFVVFIDLMGIETLGFPIHIQGKID